MTIKQVEEQTGLARSNIRFYEKEKLIQPSRNEQNSYRDYSKKDIEDIKKIAFLRTLGIPVESIRRVITNEVPLYEVIQTQNQLLCTQLADLNKSKKICEKMLQTEAVSYDTLQIENYTSDLNNYWSEHSSVFKLDSFHFLHLWSSLLTWTVITLLCLVISIFSYAKLPPEIPVQWASHGTAVSMVNKNFIFAYPAVCLVIRFFLKPLIDAKIISPYSRFLSEYLTNYLCFVTLSIEIFSIFYLYNLAENVVTVLLIDTIVLIGLLILGISKVKRTVNS